jgi:hypothetical protein
MRTAAPKKIAAVQAYRKPRADISSDATCVAAGGTIRRFGRADDRLVVICKPSDLKGVSAGRAQAFGRRVYQTAS